MIRVENLSRSFGSAIAIDSVDFSIERNSGITALLGPNGAGKTTTMRIMTGYLTPGGGDVTIDDMSIRDEELHPAIKKRIGYLPETTPLYREMLVYEYLEFMGRVRGLSGTNLTKRLYYMVERLELGSHLYSKIEILSKGFRQRVALGGTLIHDPDVIILDEPTSGLDPNQIAHIRAFIQELGKETTLMLSTHILQEVEDICDRVIIMHQGKVIKDAPVDELQFVSSSYYIVARGSNISQTIQALDSVVSVSEPASDSGRIVPEGFQLLSCEFKEDRPELAVQALVNTGADVREVVPVRRSLQDAFQELTGGA